MALWTAASQEKPECRLNGRMLEAFESSFKVSLFSLCKIWGSRNQDFTAALASSMNARFTPPLRWDVAIKLRVPYLKFVPCSNSLSTVLGDGQFHVSVRTNLDDDSWTMTKCSLWIMDLVPDSVYSVRSFGKSLRSERWESTSISRTEVAVKVRSATGTMPDLNWLYTVLVLPLGVPATLWHTFSSQTFMVSHQTTL